MRNVSFFRSILAMPLAIGLGFALLGLTPAFKTLELGLYDAFLAVKPEVKASPDIVLLDVDDAAIDSVGAWPWPRSVMADGLVDLAALGARYAVFDIEYVDKSPRGVDAWYLEHGLRPEIDRSVGAVSSGIGDLFGAIQSRQVSPGDAQAFTADLIGQAEGLKSSLYEAAYRMTMDGDAYLGQALRFFGPSFLTLNLQEQANRKDIPAASLDRLAYPGARFAAPRPDFRYAYVPIPELVAGARGGGFVNAEVDADGKRRRVSLVESLNGRPVAQLALRPLLDWFGDPPVAVGPGRLAISGALFPDGVRRDLAIPLDEGGHMLINWPHRGYDAGFFSHVSFKSLMDLRNGEATLVQNLGQLADRQAWLFVGGNAARQGADDYAAVAALRRQALKGDAADKDAYLRERRRWLDSVAGLGASNADQELIAAINRRLESARGDQKDLLIQERAKLVGAFAALRDSLAAHRALEGELAAKLGGKLCLIGMVAQTSSDIGATPFAAKFFNVGTHAAVANTILQRQFLSVAPWWLAIPLTVALPLAVVLLIRRQSPLRQNLFGAGATLLIFAAALAVFALGGYFVPVLGLGLAVFFSYLSFTIYSFFRSERDKNFLRKAFGSYMAKDVINELLLNPDTLRLGGQKRDMTAMFTDIKGFSSVSEKLDPERLVELLNHYLSRMSDIAMEHAGVIDKFEGDAIIAFWGAPVPRADHALQACLAAVRMKRAERELNDRFLADGLSPTPLLTRIGVNSGDMVVGNMGTVQKMDYTIMGSNVNLASRLEGVNKYYGTWILAAERTVAQCPDQLAVRPLDRVRVVGIEEPVLLYEILDDAVSADDRTRELVERFADARSLYLGRQWAKAQKALGDLLRDYPGDGPSQTFLRRCKEFQAKPPRDDWDGVATLTEK